MKADITEGMKCANCGSLNITLDMSTGKVECLDCHGIDKAKTFNLEDYKNDSIEKEENRRHRMEILGTKVTIKDKLPDNKDNNDYTKIGL